jgi:hypothetical protein
MNNAIAIAAAAALPATFEARVVRCLQPGEDMKVVHARPPNFDVIDLRGLLFAYGDTIYMPDGEPIPPELMEHEKVHGHQQREIGGPEVWWARYYIDPAFRLAQEQPAHVAELIKYRELHPQRQDWRKYLRLLATRLSDRLYGNITTQKQAEAYLKAAIKEK